MNRPLEEGTIRTPDGRELAWCAWGDSRGLPVVSHHGTPGARLGRHPDDGVYVRSGVRLITFDRAGYGRSTARPRRKVADAANDVEALADALGLERFGVEGGSGGGPHALACAALLGGRVTRVAVTVGAAPSDDPEFDFLAGMTDLNVREFSAALEGEEALAGFIQRYVDAIRADVDAVLDEIGRELPPSDQEVLQRPDERAVFRETFLEAIARGGRGWIDDDLAFTRPWGFDLGAIGIPVKLWQGELDVLVPRSHCEYLASKIQEARFELVPGAGHLLVDHDEAMMRWLAGG